MTAGTGNQTRISWSKASTLTHWTIPDSFGPCCINNIGLYVIIEQGLPISGLTLPYSKSHLIALLPGWQVWSSYKHGRAYTCLHKLKHSWPIMAIYHSVQDPRSWLLWVLECTLPVYLVYFIEHIKCKQYIQGMYTYAHTGANCLGPVPYTVEVSTLWISDYSLLMGCWTETECQCKSKFEHLIKPTH